jgi:GLPGLI family protein
MKRIFTLSWLLTGLFIVSSLAGNAKDFKGVITYKITIEGSSVTDELRAMMPKTMTLTIKGNIAKMDMVMGMGKTSAITNADEKTSINMVDMMGQKYAVKSTSEDIAKEMENAKDYQVEFSNETKEIAGYNCKKAIVRHVSDGTEIIVYYTEDLGTGAMNFDNPQFKDIKGIMLEFEMPNPEFSMHFIATTVEEKNVSDSEFTIPEGYQIKTKEEFQTMFGGGF